uniref:DUF559 domain-containing protein n=1 Tax=viral metagenome TaxID=1070528 RepID=A0A6M3KAT4_9ZZZZ
MVEENFTDIEQMVEDWLIKHKIPYQSQVSLRGGAFELGGSKIDFIIEGNICLRIQGSYWHSGVEKIGRDAVQRELLESDGWIIVDLWEDIIKDPARFDQAMRLAIQGEEMPH